MLLGFFFSDSAHSFPPLCLMLAAFTRARSLSSGAFRPRFRRVFYSDGSGGPPALNLQDGSPILFPPSTLLTASFLLFQPERHRSLLQSFLATIRGGISRRRPFFMIPSTTLFSRSEGINLETHPSFASRPTYLVKGFIPYCFPPSLELCFSFPLLNV